MTVSHHTRTRDQLWSDLLVALGGSEAFLTRSLSERKILLEILETYGSSVSLLNTDDVDALLAAVVNAAGGSASHLRQSKHQMLAALVTALGGTAPDALRSSTGELLAACVNAADTGGGGGEPEWVPDGGITVLDFKNGQYWFGGQEHTQGETIEQNTDWGSFDPAKIVEGVGVRATGSSGLARTKFVLTSAAAAGLMPTDGGFTAVATFSNTLSGTDGQAQTVIDVLDLSTFNVEWSAILLRNQTGQSNLLSGGDDAATPVGADATAHVAAFTLSPTHIAGSVDGNAVDAVENIIDNSAATHIAVQVQVFLTDATGTAILEKLVFYAPVSDETLIELAS